MLIVLFSLLVNFEFCLSNENILSVEYIRIMNSFSMGVILGEKHQKSYLEIDMSLDYLWVTPYIYNNEISSTRIMKTEYELQFRNKEIQCQMIRDQLILPNDNNNNIITKDFTFFLIPHEEVYETDSIGLGLKYDDKMGTNLVHVLKREKIIDKMTFAFVGESRNYGHLYFGGIPKSVIQEKKLYHIAKAKVDESFNTWGFNLSHIIFTYKNQSNIIYINNEYSYINSKKAQVYAPMTFISYFNQTIMKDYFEDGSCTYIPFESKYLFTCKATVAENFPNIAFIVDNIKIEISGKDLFDQSLNQFYFIFRINEININQWMFGSDFLSEYITQFDYENKEITFYSDKPFVYLVEQSILIRKNILITLIIIMLIFSFLIGIPKKIYE